MQNEKMHVTGTRTASIDVISAEPYKNLGYAVVETATIDYVNGLVAMMQDPDFDGEVDKRIYRIARSVDRNVKKDLIEAYNFLNGSDLYYLFTDLDHKTVLKKLKEKAVRLLQEKRKEVLLPNE